MESDDRLLDAHAAAVARAMRSRLGAQALPEAYRCALDAILATDGRRVDHSNRVIEALLRNPLALPPGGSAAR